MTGWWKFWRAEIHKRLASIRILPPYCATSANPRAAGWWRAHPCITFLSILILLSAAAPDWARTTTRVKAQKRSGAAAEPATASKGSPSDSQLREAQLAKLARSLRDHPNATAYSALAAFASRNARNEVGPRAALALAYYDLSRDKAELAQSWIRKAAGEKLLAEYDLYWQAQISIGLGQKDQAVQQLETFRREYPSSVMTELAVTALAQTALGIGKPDEALDALTAYSGSANKPALLLLRAQAEEAVETAKGEKPVAATADYLDLYYRFPLNDEAKVAGDRIPVLQEGLGDAFPGTPIQQEMARAEAFYVARRWREASKEYVALLPKISGVDHERADLRIVQCDVQLGGRLQQLSDLAPTDPDLDAERLYSIQQVYRTQKDEQPMLQYTEELAQKYPKSSWTADALFSAGNFYWANLDRIHAVDFYRRSLDATPDSANAKNAEWRIAWTAYMDRKPEAVDLIEAFVRRYPTANYVPDALYWLGRLYERAGNAPHARSFYLVGANRFPLTYFGELSADRLRPAPEGIGSSPVDAAEFLSSIPAPAPLPQGQPPLVAEAEQRQLRAEALSDIAFDSSAELEYRAAYAETHQPKFLIAAAGAAIAAGHYASGMATIRQAIPQLEGRRIAEVPAEAWRAAFPLPYELNLRSVAARNQLDPMLVAGLIRQESAFESSAMSRVGAMGLMQVMPKTAYKMARQMRVGYRRTRLIDPGYNLRLGSHYLANLLQMFPTKEAALAAYNAGEDHVTEWTTGQNYLETAEFVESIPFTETREYVQIVMRNAEVYREIYGPVPASEQQSRLSVDGAMKAAAVPSAAGTHPASAGEIH